MPFAHAVQAAAAAAARDRGSRYAAAAAAALHRRWSFTFKVPPQVGRLLAVASSLSESLAVKTYGNCVSVAKQAPLTRSLKGFLSVVSAYIGLGIPEWGKS